MLISEPDHNSLLTWFNTSQYSIMGIYLTSGEPEENKILSSLVDNWQEIDNLSGSSFCFIYFDSKTCKSYKQFITWVRDVNYSGNIDLQQVADDTYLLSKNICDKLGILYCDLPCLLLLEKGTSNHFQIPITSYLEIQAVLNVVRLLSSFAHDRDTIFMEMEKLKRDRIVCTNIFHLKQREILDKMTKENKELSVTESKLSDKVFQNNDILINGIHSSLEFYRKYWEVIHSYNLENDSFCKKSLWAMMIYLKKRSIAPSEPLLEAFNQLRHNINALSKMAHVHPDTIYCEIEKGYDNLKTIIINGLDCYHSRLSIKKETLNKSLLKSAEGLKSLEDKYNRDQAEYTQNQEIARKEANNRLITIIDSYCLKIQAKTGLNQGVCKSLLQGLNSSTLYSILKDIIQKTNNLTILSRQANLTAITSAVRNSNFDVFISCKSEDYGKAHEVFDFLVKNGKKPFLADISLDQIHMDEYNNVIREAIDMCPSMIVLASSPEYVRAPYVSYEWNLYANEKAAGRKTGNLIPIISNISDIPDLPIALRVLQACTIDNYQNHLLPYLSE